MIVDVHVHPWNPNFLSRDFAFEIRSACVRAGAKPPMIEPLEVDELIEDMDEARIDKTWLLAIDFTRVWNSSIPNEYVIECVKKYPDRLVGFASIEPKTKENTLNRRGLQNFEKLVEEHGMRGLKLGPCYNHYYPNEKVVYPFYEKAVELNVPIIFHQGATVFRNAPLKYANPVLLEDVALDFPDLKIVVAHMGYPWTPEVLTLMRKQPNVYTDISALCMRPSILSWNLVMAKEYNVIHKVLFGTDYPGFCRPQKDYVEWCRTKFNQIADRAGWPTLSDLEVKGLLGENAMKLIRP